MCDCDLRRGRACAHGAPRRRLVQLPRLAPRNAVAAAPGSIKTKADRRGTRVLLDELVRIFPKLFFVAKDSKDQSSVMLFCKVFPLIVTEIWP